MEREGVVAFCKRREGKSKGEKYTCVKDSKNNEGKRRRMATHMSRKEKTKI